ncbi:MAG: hypothetical protein ACO22Z_11870 [Paracoccaceae bacterium]
MTGASKILTVSYGTFSCTLEGFDDPFNTMKAIAEYFRDLAAGDRYFGAEPPTPDAAMLHRIAEREIQRRVEAKIQDNGVILRAGDAAEAPTAEPVARPALLDAPCPLPETGAESVAARLQRIRARHAQAAPVSAAVAASAAEAPRVTAAAAVEDDYTEDQHADDLPVPVALAAAQIEPFDQADVTDSFAPASSFSDAAFDVPEALISDTPVADAEAPLVTAAALLPVEAPVTPPADMIEDDDQEFEQAAEIDFARLAEQLDDKPAARAAEPYEDLPEDQQSDSADLAAALSDVDPMDMPEEVASLEAADHADVDEDALLSRLSLSEDLPPATDEVQAVDASLAASLAMIGAATAPSETKDLDDTEDLTLESLPETQIDAEAEADTDPAIEADEPPMMIENLDQIAQDAPADVNADPADMMPDEPTTEAAPRVRARVIRIRRAAPPEADTNTTSALEAAIDAKPDARPATTSVLSDEAEAALQAELAALEAELGGTVEAIEPEAQLEVTPEVAPEVAPLAAAAAPEPAAAPRPINVPAEDEAVSRLMAQAASQMGGEETRRRQSAIAHLKAAVAATEADRAVTGGRSAQGEQRMEPYRDDLERVVRPRRPQVEATTPRPPAVPDAAARPTPLVLVSAQRIDQPRPAATQSATPDLATARVVMPVRPRRPVLAQPGPDAVAPHQTMMQEPDQAELDEDEALTLEEAENLFSDATSFQDFADQLGAEALPDLLEAAAVYCAEVLQRPEFSRPLVMRQLAALPGQSQTAREEYLRGFGTLLRQGRITKVKRGMFALTDRSPYLAEARKLAG